MVGLSVLAYCNCYGFKSVCLDPDREKKMMNFVFKKRGILYSNDEFCSCTSSDGSEAWCVVYK